MIDATRASLGTIDSESNSQITEPNQVHSGQEVGMPVKTLPATPEQVDTMEPEISDVTPRFLVAEHAIAGSAIQASLHSSLFSANAPAANTQSSAGNVLYTKTTGSAQANLVRNDYLRPTKAVREMQHSVNEWRAKNGKPPISESGKFDAQTETAVKEFQQAIGMKPANGVFGPATRERLAIENDSNFQSLNDSTKKGIRDYLNSVGLDASAIANVKNVVTQTGFLGHVRIFENQGFRSLDKATKMNLIKELQDYANNPEKAHNLTNLVETPGFEKLSRESKSLLVNTQISQPGNKQLVEGFRELMRGPEFEGLSNSTKDTMLRALANYGSDTQVAENLRNLVEDSNFARLDPEMKERLIQSLGDSPGGKSTVKNLMDVATTPGFKDLDPEIQSRALGMVASGFQDAPFGPAEIKNLMQVVTASGFEKLPSDIRDYMLETLMAQPGNARLAEGLHDLSENPRLAHDPRAARKAINELEDRVR